MAKLDVADEDLPPIVPTELKDLRRALALLGERAKGELSQKVREKLTELVGHYPDRPTAIIWKRALKSVQHDEIFKPTGESAAHSV